MPEIKVNQTKITPVLQRLKQQTAELNTTPSSIEFSQSRLNLIEEIKTIEEKYYDAIEKYKKSLLKVEEDVEASINTYVEKDEQLASGFNNLRK
ncbi:hypothetical protein CAI16_15180 [Virgibacillus dokdonensis]|uniref:YwqI/YxiC family protein n=1 Tax=Virgibacillus dokdonensis TaxID=302167 RepID=A0A3E0WK75_9BACI|nr:DUF5344 family protein [Virgibacillus dokdonensis]RFA33350.1 hypothetical protein CAI16_15180 [Virgibacillus dokdonensis]